MSIVFDTRLDWNDKTEEYRFPAVVNRHVVQCVVTKQAMTVGLEVPPEEVRNSDSFIKNRGVIRAVAKRLIEEGRKEEGEIIIRETDFQ
jgi:hypothetical protein